MITERQIQTVADRTLKDMYILGADVMAAAGVTYTDNATVLAVQKALKAKGFDPGKFDGIYGPNTAKAIRAMQSAAGIPETGVIDYGVLSALGVQAPSVVTMPDEVVTATKPKVPTASVPIVTPSPAVGIPPWKIGLAAGGVGLLAIGLTWLAVRR